MLMEQIAERRMPVFGIGAGMQLLNVSQGGKLFLHLPEDLPTAIPHKDPHDPEHRHGLEVVFGTLMERVYGDGEIRVNSMHHQAIDEVAPGFKVTARCPDGVIEAIESTQDDWLAIGTQFHPEAESASALDVRIFEEFVDGITQAGADDAAGGVGRTNRRAGASGMSRLLVALLRFDSSCLAPPETGASTPDAPARRGP